MNPALLDIPLPYSDLTYTPRITIVFTTPPSYLTTPSDTENKSNETTALEVGGYGQR